MEQLATGILRRGNHNTYLNSVRSTLRACGINPTDLENLASDRVKWCSAVKEGIAQAEKDRIECLKEKRRIRKAKADLAHMPT